MTPPTDRSAAVELSEIRVDRGGSTVLTVDHLRVGAGLTAVVGPNGSGKSTLLHVIAGLIEPVGGSVTVRQRVAYVVQTPPSTAHLLVTALEVVTLGRAALRGAFGRITAADRAVVHDAMARLEVVDLSDRHMAELSGGQRQRVFIAQGLAQDAPLLLLDEPTAGLDLTSIELVNEVIAAERAAGRSIVVATHDLAEAGRADAVVLLDRAVIAAGPPTHVLTPRHLRAAYGSRVLDLGGQTVAIDDGVHHGEHDHDHHAGRTAVDEHGKHPHDHTHQH